MNKDQGTGIFERAIYGSILFLVLKFGGKLGLNADDAAWIAGGGVALAGGAWAWWRNRPVSVLNRASEVIPPGSELIISTAPDATHAERMEASQLAEAANSKVVAS